MSAQSEDQTGITWFDPNYPHMLNQFSIMHYFELSPFFDRASNNTLSRQQGHDPAIPGALEFVVPQGGMEYVLELAQVPHLFVIRKQMRKGPDTAAPGALNVLAFYYVLDKVIYQAPSLYAVLHSRIRRCTWSLHQGFGKLQADLDPLKAQLRRRDKLLQGEARLRQQRQEQREQQQQQQQQQQGLQQGQGAAGEGGGAGAGGVDTKHGPLGVSVEGEEEERALGKAAQPMPTVQRVNAADAAQWRRTDNIIMAVLSRYELPAMPASYYLAPRPGYPGMPKQEEEEGKGATEQEQAAAAPNAPEQPQPEQQQQQQQPQLQQAQQEPQQQQQQQQQQVPLQPPLEGGGVQGGVAAGTRSSVGGGGTKRPRASSSAKAGQGQGQGEVVLPPGMTVPKRRRSRRSRLPWRVLPCLHFKL